MKPGGLLGMLPCTESRSADDVSRSGGRFIY